MSATDDSNNWHLWCRLCAKDDLQGNINVFLKNEQTNTGDSALATAIGRYFWVNITRGEELPEMICADCLTLVTTLVNFSERITRVQKFYCILQSHKSQDEVNLRELRLKFGLIDDEEEEVEREEKDVQNLTEVHYVDEKPKIDMEDELNVEEEMATDLPNEVENPLNEDQDEEGRDEEEQFLLKFCNTYGLDENDEVDGNEEIVGDDEDEEEEDEAEEEPGKDKDNNLAIKSKPNSRSKRNKSHQCSECKRVYATSGTLSRHLRYCHAEATTTLSTSPMAQFSCPECPKKFHNHWNLKRHTQQHLPLPKRKMFPCPNCDKKFTSNASALQHVQYMHQDERPRPVICEQCGVAVHSISALKEHVLKHTDYAPFECDICKKCFKSSNRLKHHKETHDPHKYICPECGMQLNSRPTLNRHRLVHTDKMQHKCDYCGKEFKRAKALKNHLILHTGLKPYSCDFCDRTFANGSNCRTHKKKSHPEELAAQEAAGGAKNYNRNIPKLEALKAFTKNRDNLSPVVTKQSGCFAFGKKPKPQIKSDASPLANEVSPPAASSSSIATIPTIDNIYNHIMKQQSPPATKPEQTTTTYQQQQQQILISSDGSATLVTTTQQQQQEEEQQQQNLDTSPSGTQIYSY
ncbi:uncharacterized protein Dwil_GK14921 [Drosophila willistoni]|uniref:Zinc finger protein weckle n=1 Tax=Drosophila willistoni TaxID=7260 RepID=B4MWA3_DROWI|nr:uncharacterized protein Dwil_GK14921 [Drosophila willistoni]